MLFALIGLPSIASAAGPAIFINFGDIRGSSVDEYHTDWIDAFSISEAMAAPPVSRSDVAAVNPTYAPFQITKGLDKASVKLREALLKGTHIPEVVVELTMPLNTQQVILRIRLKEVLVSTLSMTAPALLGLSTSDTAVTSAKEIVTIVPGAIEWEFYSYGPDGTVDGQIIVNWSFVKGAAG